MVDRRNHLRDILKKPRTRSQTALARELRSQLASNNFPSEMILKIMENLNNDQEPMNTTLFSCCLVCRPWKVTGQYALFRNVTLREAIAIKKFYRSLKKSDIMGLNVRSLNLELSPFPLLKRDDQLALARMISECLKCTRDLAKLAFDKTSSRHLLSTPVVRSLCALPKLKALTIQQHHTRWATGLGQSSFELHLLNNLPKTIEDLAILSPLDDLFDVLPTICERLYQPRLTVTPPSPSHQQASGDARSCVNHENGSSSLSLHLEQQEPRLLNLFTALSTSISTKLFKLSIIISPVIREAHIREPLLVLMKAIPLLEELELGLIGMRGSLFDSMPPFSRLRALKIVTCRALYDENWEHFCEALPKFIRHSPKLQRFELRADLRELSLDQLVDGIIKSTIRVGMIGGSTLTSFAIGNVGLPNHIPTRQNYIEEFDHENFVAPSIETFEDLCHLAPNLKHLEIAVPLDELPRVSAALVKLSQLSSAKLNNYPISRPLGGEGLDFDSFFETCDHLNQLLAQER